MWNRDVNFEELKGKTLREIKNLGYELHFVTKEDETYIQYHSQNCCESVDIEDICGDLNDLVGSPILMAEEVVSCEDPEGYVCESEWRESFTWSFYKLSTIKGSVTIRWYGTSNGYYSETVSLRKE